MSDHFRIIGDVHGCIKMLQKRPPYVLGARPYLDIIKDCDYSVQLGDMSLDYADLDGINFNHRFFGGNHDNYDTIFNVPNSLGNFGLVSIGGIDFFFIRGAFSIDAASRLNCEWWHGRKLWWKQEQLLYSQANQALSLYERVKPDIMITHSCPKEVADIIGSPEALRAFGFEPKTFTTFTQTMLSRAFEIHKPRLWVFGHFHKDVSLHLDGTQFVCLNELQYLSLDKNANITNFPKNHKVVSHEA